jgi:hypothetical protein
MNKITTKDMKTEVLDGAALISCLSIINILVHITYNRNQSLSLT